MSKIFDYPFTPIPYGATAIDQTGEYNKGIYTAETTQRFMCATRQITWDGRVFKYARAGSARTTGYSMSFQNSKFAGSGASTSTATIATATVVGERTVSYLVVVTDGYAGDGIVAKNALAGGFIVVLGATPAHQFRQIVENNAAATTTMIITVDWPWTSAVDAATTCCIWYNPYYDVRQIAEDYISVAGIPLVTLTSGQFHWLQTWGPCRISGHAATDGIVAGDRRCYFGPNGDIRPGDGVNRQLAGFYIERTNASVGAGYNPLFMLQISP